jgi:ATP-dependent DNA helicase DinG
MLNLDQFFDYSGPLAAVLGTYRKRDEQVRLAKTVAATLKGGGALLGDGPTGTGTSMAYLAPVALGMTAAGNHMVAGQAVVSTATKALQHQLVAKDIPTLAAACEQAGVRVPTFALLKGRGEFLCDRRMDEYVEEAGLVPPQELVEIDRWRRRTNTGDKESLPITPPAFWSEIAADGDDCVRKGCDYEDSCFYYTQKERAVGADILVVNHALLLANLASGERVFSMRDKHLIIDEAHRLEEYVCEAFGARVSRRRVRYVLNAVRRKAHDLGDYLESADAAAVEFFTELRGSANRALGSPMSAPPSYTVLVDELTAIRNLVENNPAEAVNKLAGMVDKLLADLRHFYEPLLGTHAYAVLDPRGGRGFPTLQSWLVEPREVVPEHILEREEGAATIMTSATLATGRSFEYQRRRLGFDVSSVRTREHLGAEMFDYENNALVYLEPDLPPPVPSRVDEFLDGAVGRAAELVMHSGGRALILLATWKAVQRFKDVFGSLVPYPVRFQGDGSTSTLISWLRDTPNAVLVGTRSLWEGVDVAGDALSLVIVDKVPFPPPNDPVIAKLCEKAGSQWFMEVSLPKAMLAIRQGLGRLIRRHDDKGVMAILDSRMTTSTWAPAMRRAVPRGAPITDDVIDVAEFFGGVEAA